MNIIKRIKTAITHPSFSISKNIIQKEIETGFPKTYEKFMSSITIHDPTVEIPTNEDKIELRISVTAKAPLIGEKLGCFSANGSLSFNKEQRAIYIVNPKITSFEIPGLSESVANPLKKLVEIGLTQILENKPIHEIPESFATRSIQNITIEEGKIIVYLGLE